MEVEMSCFPSLTYSLSSLTITSKNTGVLMCILKAIMTNPLVEKDSSREKKSLIWCISIKLENALFEKICVFPILNIG